MACWQALVVPTFLLRWHGALIPVCKLIQFMGGQWRKFSVQILQFCLYAFLWWTYNILFSIAFFFSNPLSLSEASYILWPVGIYTCSQASKPKRCGKAKEKIWGKVVDWHWDFHGEGWQVQMSYCEAVIITIDCFSCYLQILWKCTDKYEGIWRTLQLLLAI